MTLPLREQFVNNAQDELDGGIDGSQTTLDVDDATPFPSTGNFRIKIDSEILLVTGVSSNTFTVVRGIEDTSGASHSDGATVMQIVTDSSFNRLVKDSVTLAGDDSPAPVMNTLVADNGSTILTASDFTWDNQGAATAQDQGGTILLTTVAASGENLRVLVRSAPSPPYSYIAAFRHVGMRSDDTSSAPNFGILLRQSSSGKLTNIQCICDGNGPTRIQVADWTNSTTHSATSVTRAHFCNIGPEMWQKIEDDGTNIKCYLGDGLAWFLIYSVSRTNHQSTTGPDQVGWYGAHASSNGKWPSLVRLCHWSRAS